VNERSEPRPWQQYKAPNGHLSLELPGDWAIDEQSEMAVFCEPGEGACIALTAFTRPFATLREFAESKFRVESYYRALSNQVPSQGPGWEGVEREFEGWAPEDDSPTLCRISCMHGGGLFVSLTLYTSPERYARSHEPYDKIRSSLRILPIGGRPWWKLWGH
jgi:hypothetical protein